MELSNVEENVAVNIVVQQSIARGQLYEDITRRGRSFGVHLLLASQSLNINNINNRIYGFIPLRMAMQMDQTTANIVLAEGNTDAVELLDRSPSPKPLKERKTDTLKSPHSNVSAIGG